MCNHTLYQKLNALNHKPMFFMLSYSSCISNGVSVASVGITLPILLIGMTLQTGENTALPRWQLSWADSELDWPLCFWGYTQKIKLNTDNKIKNGLSLTSPTLETGFSFVVSETSTSNDEPIVQSISLQFVFNPPTVKWFIVIKLTDQKIWEISEQNMFHIHMQSDFAWHELVTMGTMYGHLWKGKGTLACLDEG